MRPNLFLATIGRGSNGSNALEVTEDRAAVTAESQDNIINRVNNVSQYGPSWHYVPGIGVAGTAYAEVPGSALGDLAFSRASSKTRTNSAGLVETIASNVPPHDYRNADGTLSTFPRLNLEPQRTNSIRNSSMVGAVAGSPGTLPTNWTASASGGLTRSIVAIGTENGLPFIDIRFQGTASGVDSKYLFETSTSIAASTGQTWGLSFYAKIVSGTSPTMAMWLIERAAAGVYVTEVNSPRTLTSSLERYSFIRTLIGGATVVAVQPGFYMNLTNGATYDFTIRIAAPQMELGAYATTWVPTTTAAVTRLADAASKTGVSSLIGQTEGTLFAEVNLTSVKTGTFLSISEGTTANRVDFGVSVSNLFFLVRISATESASTVQTVSGAVVAGRYKIAVGYKSGNTIFYINGVQSLPQITDTFTFVNALTKLSVGSARNDTNQMGDGVAQAALFPTRLTNAQLAQLTTL